LSTDTARPARYVGGVALRDLAARPEITDEVDTKNLVARRWTRRPRRDRVADRPGVRHVCVMTTGSSSE
jgi:hypothetical protein